MGRLALVEQAGHERAGGVHEPVEVHAEHPVPVGEGPLPEHPAAEHPGVVAQQVHRPEAVERPVGEPLDLVGERHVGRRPPRASAPPAHSSSTTASSAGSSTSAATSRMPWDAARSSSALPIPLAAPVTTATIPFVISMAEP